MEGKCVLFKAFGDIDAFPLCVKSQEVDEIVNKMKEWLGLTGEIKSWSDFFNTRLGQILTTVGSIGLGLATWKLSNKVLGGLNTLMSLKKSGLDKAAAFTLGVSLAVTGITLEWSAIINTIKPGLSGFDFAIAEPA